MLSESPDRNQLDAVFAALSNAKRRAMLEILSQRPSTVGALADDLDISLQSMHRHIRALETAGLIQRRKAGRVNFVAIKRPSLAEARRWMGDFHPDWGHDEATLENFIAHMRGSDDG
jgi:DNA-binding transcriptional ArsR family regulator